MQFEGELKPKSRRSQLSYFANHTFKVEDPYQPQFYTKVSFKVPLPKSTRDMPCILVTLHNSKKSFFMRFESVQSLCSVFNLDENTREDLETALYHANVAWHIREAAERDSDQRIHETISRLPRE